MNDAAREEKTEEDEKEKEGRTYSTEKERSAMRINDVSRVHIVKEKKEDYLNGKREKKTT